MMLFKRTANAAFALAIHDLQLTIDDYMMHKTIYFLTLVFIFNAAFCFAQTAPKVDEPEKIVTEEIKLNVSAFDSGGKFVDDLKKEDLVILEDGRLHQADSVRLIAPSVLIAMDTGGETRQVKNINTTRQVAANLVNSLAANTNTALMQFSDKVEIIADWQTDKTELVKTLESRTGFGRRASFVAAINAAADYLGKSPTENRHLILITDGLDSVDDKEVRGAALKKLLTSGIVVHVVSYSQIEFAAVKPQARIWRKGEYHPHRMPEDVELLISSAMYPKLPPELARLRAFPPRLISVMVDYPFLKEKNAHLKSLAAAQIQMSLLSEFTGGEFVLPDSVKEIIEQSTLISQSINSQYVVTYSPKRSLKNLPHDEIRQIEVSSKRAGVEAQASRRLLVFETEADK